MSQLGFYYNVDKCSGCKTCQIACKDVGDFPVGTLNRTVFEGEGGTFPYPKAYFVSLSCNHCADPICVKNCPTKAMYKREDDGRVLNNPDECIRCETCVKSCPYGAPSLYKEENRIAKCDLCDSLVKSGERPACVSSCLMRAIEYGDIEELRQRYGDNADIIGIPSSAETNPSIVINLHRTLLEKS